MSKLDTCKIAKRDRQKYEWCYDLPPGKEDRSAKRKERQHGKKIIRQALKEKS